MTETTETTETTARATTNTIMIHFMDDKTVTVTVPPEKTDAFMEKLRSGDTYMDDEVDAGIWVPQGNIRYAHISPTPIDAIIAPEGTTLIETSTTNETVEGQIEAIETAETT